MKKTIEIIIVILLSISIFCLGFNYKSNKYPKTYYQVYLNGEILGTIESKTKLDNYIDKQNNKYKKQLGINKVYAPNGLEIKK